MDPQLIKAFEKSHEAHYGTLKEAQDILNDLKIPYCTVDRKRKMDYSPYPLIVTVGGDGTLLNASGQVKNQLILGVNSNPDVSVGRFCCTDRKNFKKVLTLALQNRAQTKQPRPDGFRRSRWRTRAKRLHDQGKCH